MSEELAYVILTPYTLEKSRTGGIIARLITRTGLELAAARMFSPSEALVTAYAEEIVSADDPQDRQIQERIRTYILQNLSPDPKTQKRRRVMVLLFRGDQAVAKIRSVVGHISALRTGGETLRDTYGDLILDDAGQIRYFEPAVLAAPTPAEAKTKLKIWARYSEQDGGVLENATSHPPDVTPERTLVLIKPDNFQFPSGRPGNVIDFFSRTGLSIIGIKVHRMSTTQAMEFYAPVRSLLRRKLNAVVAARAKVALEKEFGFVIAPPEADQLGQLLGPLFGEYQFDNIVRFMSGHVANELDPADRNQPGSEMCIALVYEGPEAVRKIREVLGPTDPSKAPPGSIRREFGRNIMVNAAHASDSAENARREIGIIDVGENNFRRIVDQHYEAMV